MALTGENSHCRIIVDAMGGDYAPHNAVIGAIQAIIQEPSIELYLVGKREDIIKILDSNNLSFNKECIINANEVISMSETPTIAIKTKINSSIVVGANFVKEKKADAFVSAGNTGAVMAASTLIIGRIPGVGRPTIGAAMPNVNGICYLYDVGAGKDAKPQHLFEYAVMGAIYASEVGKVKNPSIGVLSMGEEEGKGNELSEAAAKLLKNSRLNFIGNVEGRDILAGKVDIVVCDGFVGNILLKFGEAVPGLLKYLMQTTAKKNFFDKIRLGIAKGVLKKSLRTLDYQEYGGVPLLGINGISIIGHGSSTPKAIKNMVLQAKEMFDKKLTQKIEISLREYAVN